MPLSTLPPIPTVASPETKKKLRRSLLQESIDEVYGSMEALTPEAQQRVERYFPLHEVSERVRRGLSPLAPTGARQFPPSVDEPRVAAPQEAKLDALTQLVRETRARRQGGRELGGPASQYTPMGTPLTPETPPALGLVQSAVDILGTAGLKGGGFGGGGAVRNVQARPGYRRQHSFSGIRPENMPVPDVPLEMTNRAVNFARPPSITSEAPEGYLPRRNTLSSWPPAEPPRAVKQAILPNVSEYANMAHYEVPIEPPIDFPAYSRRPASWDPQSKYSQALDKWHQKQEQPDAFDWLNDLPYTPATRSLTKEYKEAKEQEGQLPLLQEFQPEQFMKRPERTGRFANIELDLPPPKVKWPKMYQEPGWTETERTPNSSKSVLDIPQKALAYAKELGRDPKELFTTKRSPSESSEYAVDWIAELFDNRKDPKNPEYLEYLKAWATPETAYLRGILREGGRNDIVDYLEGLNKPAQEPSKRAIDLDLPSEGATPAEEAWARRLNAMRDTSKLVNEYLPKQPRGVKWEEIAAILRTTQETPEVKAAKQWLQAKYGVEDYNINVVTVSRESKELYKQETGKDWPAVSQTPNIDQAINYFKARYPRQFGLAEKVQSAPQDVVNMLASRPAFDTGVLGVTTQTGQRGSALHGQLGMATGLSPGERQALGAITNKPSVMISQQAHERGFGPPLLIIGDDYPAGYEPTEEGTPSKPKSRLALETVGHEIGGHVVDWTRAAKGLAGKKRLQKGVKAGLPARSPMLAAGGVGPLGAITQRPSDPAPHELRPLDALPLGQSVKVDPSRQAFAEGRTALDSRMGLENTQRSQTLNGIEFKSLPVPPLEAQLIDALTGMVNAVPNAGGLLPQAVKTSLLDPIEARAERQGRQVASRAERVKALIPELAVNDLGQLRPTAAEQAAYDKGVKVATVTKFTKRTGLSYLAASKLFRGGDRPLRKEPKIGEAILRRAAAEAVLKQLIKEGKREGKGRQIEPLEAGEAPDKSVLPDYSKLVFEELGSQTKKGVEEQMREETERRKGMYYGKVPWTQEEADAIMLKMFGKYGKKR